MLQDEASPASLTDLCLSYMTCNLERFCVKQADGSLCLRESLVFPQELADQLLAKMATEGEQGVSGGMSQLVLKQTVCRTYAGGVFT